MVSVDDAETNKRFAAEHDADFPILSDPGKTVGTAYGVLGTTGLARRWTFYIGPDGKIVDIDRKVSPGTSGQDIVTHLKALNAPMAKK